MNAEADKRAAGIAKMQEVYGFSVDPDTIPGRYAEMTVDHLFGTVWTSDELDVRDRRLMTIGILAALGKSDLLDIQFDCALERDELTVDQLREVIVHITHYIGWPMSTGMNQTAENVIARSGQGRRGRQELVPGGGGAPLGAASRPRTSAPASVSSRFNRPEVRNAFDTAMYHELTAALRAADADEDIGAVVLTGRGSAFTSGQDLAEMAAIATGTAVEGAGQGFMGLLDCLTELSVPLLAAVNGVAVGLGFTLLAHCDLVLVASDARLRVPFAELGVPPEAASSFLFPAAMGWQQAARILLTSDWVRPTSSSRWAWRCARATPTASSTRRWNWRLASLHTLAPPTRAITSLMRAARRDAVLEANRREQGAFAQLLGGAAQHGTLADFADKTP